MPRRRRISQPQDEPTVVEEDRSDDQRPESASSTEATAAEAPQTQEILEPNRIAVLWEQAAPRLRRIADSTTFAYSLAAVLAIPAALYLTTPVPHAAPGESAALEHDEVAPTPAIPAEPRARALRLLQHYEDALRARDINRLRDVWEMTPGDEAALRELFADARIVSPLVDLQHVAMPTNDATGNQRIVFAQVLTLVRGAGQFYARGPTVYEAEIVPGPGFDFWRMRSRREITDGDKDGRSQ